VDNSHTLSYAYREAGRPGCCSSTRRQQQAAGSCHSAAAATAVAVELLHQAVAVTSDRPGGVVDGA